MGLTWTTRISEARARVRPASTINLTGSSRSATRRRPRRACRRRDRRRLDGILASTRSAVAPAMLRAARLARRPGRRHRAAGALSMHLDERRRRRPRHPARRGDGADPLGGDESCTPAVSPGGRMSSSSGRSSTRSLVACSQPSASTTRSSTSSRHARPRRSDTPPLYERTRLDGGRRR